MLRLLAVGLLLGAAIVRPVQAQDTIHAPADSLTDSVERARSAGSAAAGERNVGGYFGLAFLGGVPTGLFLPVGFFFGEPLTATAGAAGAALIFTTISLATSQTTEPPLHSLRPFDATPQAQQAFRDAYAARLKQRRVRASYWGGAIGTGIGLGILASLVQQFDY